MTEAFHPHPELPIYTVSAPGFAKESFGLTNLEQDADKGHVQIKDLTLEIVDLR